MVRPEPAPEIPKGAEASATLKPGASPGYGVPVPELRGEAKQATERTGETVRG